ncbi:MAG: fatty acid desaturase, partial [Verrucomicrobiales bacterium]
SGPQIYGIAHATHHKNVHTFEDLEFWPTGGKTTVARARIALIFELFFGIIAWSLRATPGITKHPRYSRRSGVIFIVGSVLLFAGLMFAARGLYGDLYWYAAAAYWLHLLLFAVALRMLQYLEHLGITAPDLDYKTRTKLTRNARCSGFLNWIWHKITLNETAEHTLHHQRAGIPYRRYLPRAPSAPSTPVRTVSVTDLPRIIWNYWKDPLRVIGPDSPEIEELRNLE